MGRSGRRLALLLALAAFVAALAHAPASAFSGGKSDRAALGCGDAGCHGAMPSAAVTPVLEGLPDLYTPGETYILNVTLTGARAALPPPVGQAAGGFALGATDGALAPPPGAADVQVEEATGNATHTKEGSLQRAWTVVWTAPPPTAGVVTFHLAVNAVNGNALPDALDEWALASFATNEGPVPEGPPRPRPSDGGAAGEPASGATGAAGGSSLPAPGAPALALAAVAAALLATGARRRG